MATRPIPEWWNEPIPPKPAEFTPEGAPPGVINKCRSNPFGRPKMRERARLQLAHTNAAGARTSIESQWRWATAGNTQPHYEVGWHKDNGWTPGAEKWIPTDRTGTANATGDWVQGEHGDVKNWSLCCETNDDGTNVDPNLELGFVPEVGELLARIFAYEAIVWGIPLEYPTEWYGPGSACHTEPFPYPYWTIKQGKTCPGVGKKYHVREWILPRARMIRDAWLGITTGDEFDMATLQQLEEIVDRNVNEAARWLVREPDGSPSELVKELEARFATLKADNAAQANGVLEKVTAAVAASTVENRKYIDEKLRNFKTDVIAAVAETIRAELAPKA
jgi:hypothetical protein